MIILILKLIAVFFVSYLIGSISTGYIAVKLLKNIDIRTVGSGSTGATNVKRVLGTKWFFIILLLDGIKGILPTVLAIHYFNFAPYIGLSPVIAALGVLIGHSKSVFLNFKGGKSVATGVGTILALSPQVGLITVVVFSIVTYFSRYVSVGSITAVSLAPILMVALVNNEYYNVFAAICAIYVIIRHKENIERLLTGRENKVR